ncbi:MAG: hypothetical protein FJ279_04150 [Planctomycetes bacterium]|nr:hypothetical protein [Planctomycetota bacterium]
MNKTAAPGIAELLKEVQTMLAAKCKRRRFRLRVPKHGYRVEDDWITIVVTPTRAGVDAYDYVNVLSVVEKQLRARGHEHVILVPAMGD